jgi:leader peptidase (prepilin peptidase)/N-methyltransferase
MPHAFLWAYAALIGAAVGSFLNVGIVRWPAEQSVVRPRSRCPGCGTAIPWYDNVPVLSYLLLRGRCRHCSQRISIQYPLLELGVAVIWVAAAVRFGFTFDALHSALLLSILLAIAIIDARHFIIPDQLSLGGLALGLGLAAAPDGMPLREAVIGAAVLYLALWGVAIGAQKLFRKPALGVGDIHMMAMIGAFLGLTGGLLTIMLGSLLGLLIGLPLSWRQGRLGLLKTYLPLGTYLALGAAVAHVWGDAIIGWYLATFVYV